MAKRYWSRERVQILKYNGGVVYCNSCRPKLNLPAFKLGPDKCRRCRMATDAMRKRKAEYLEYERKRNEHATDKNR